MYNRVLAGPHCKTALISALALWTLISAAGVSAQDDVFSEYREMMGDDNPAVFVSEEGADYWSLPAGPRQATLQQCDLGLGPGVVDGAYARLPRYFEDTERVMDLEDRLFHCMEQLQGRSPETIRAKPYSSTVTTQLAILVPESDDVGSNPEFYYTTKVIE